MLLCTSCQHTFQGAAGDACPQCQSTDTVALPQPPPSVVTVRFAAPGAAAFGLEVEGIVTSGQFVAAGQYLLDEGRAAWANQRFEAMAMAEQARAEEEGQSAPRIQVPGLSPDQVGEILKNVRGTD
jgi:hypothetical protein